MPRPIVFLVKGAFENSHVGGAFTVTLVPIAATPGW